MSVGTVDVEEPLRRRAAVQSSRVERYARMVESVLLRNGSSSCSVRD